MRIKALIWDVDGTMVDSEEIHRAAFNFTFSERKLGWHWDQSLYAELLKVTGGKERLWQYLRTIGHFQVDIASPEEFIRSLHAQKTAIYNHLLRVGSVGLRSGVRRLLLQAKAMGVQLAIATTTSRENVDTLLRLTLKGDGLEWQAIVSGEDVKHKKPAPEVYQLALARLGLDAQECLAIEDSSNGVRAAWQAGVPVVAVVNRYTARERFDEALVVLNSLGEPGESVKCLGGQRQVAGPVTMEQLEQWMAMESPAVSMPSA